MRIDDKESGGQAELVRQILERQQTQQADGEATQEASQSKNSVDANAVVDFQAKAQASPERMDLGRSGADKADDAVDAANRQQDVGESWQAYADQSLAAMPQSVDALAKEEKDKDRLAAEGKVSVRDLQNELAIQQRMVRG